MKRFFITPTGLFAIIVVLFLAINFSPLLQSKKIYGELDKTEPIVLSGRTVFVSDLHIKKLSDFDAKFEADNLVIVGDLFDAPEYFFAIGKSSEEIFFKVFEKLLPENSTTSVYYILSKNAHDPQLQRTKIKIGSVEFQIMGEYGLFIVNGEEVLAVHGDNFNKTGVVPCVISYFGEKLGFVLPLENFWRNFVGLDKNYWLITGHSHIPAIDYESKTANCGSQKGVPFLNGLLDIQIRTEILFDGGDIELIGYQEGY